MRWVEVAARRIAVLVREGEGPAIVWLGGFRSDMRATKAKALDGWAKARGRRFVRFDYSGHGASEGRFEDGTISAWLEDALAAISAEAGPRRSSSARRWAAGSRFSPRRACPSRRAVSCSSRRRPISRKR